MSNRTLSLTDALYDYMLSVSLREPAVLRDLRAETAPDPMVQMQIAPEQGQFMALLVRLIGARRCLELGVFTGYSALVTALALPDDGRIVACDVSEEWTAMARRYWQRAGVAHKIDLRLAPALTTLDGLLAEGGAGSFDFAFIDADKENYPAYYERVPHAAAHRWPDRRRQYAVVRQGRGPARARSGDGRAAAAERAAAPRRARRSQPVAARRRPHPGAQALAASGSSRRSVEVRWPWLARRPAAVARCSPAPGRGVSPAAHHDQGRCRAEDGCPARSVGAHRSVGGIAESSRQSFATEWSATSTCGRRAVVAAWDTPRPDAGS